MKLIAEVFPVPASAIPRLHAWRLDLRGGDAATIGGKLSYRLRKALGGHWAWTSWRIVTDSDATPESVNGVVSALWKEQPEAFKGLRQVVPDSGWSASTQAKAEYVCRGLLADADGAIRSLLAPKRQTVGDAVVERVYEARGWVVAGEPAISVSVFSRLTYRHDLKAYAARIGDPEKLLGLFVADKTSGLKGEITEIAGPLKESREWLAGITQRDEMRTMIDKAPDDELVVGVMTGRPPAYDYIMSALKIVLRTKDLVRFKVSRKDAQKTLRIEPQSRSELVKQISALLKERGLVEQAFNSSSAGLFVTGAAVEFDPRVRFGNGCIEIYDEKTILQKLQSHGLYRKDGRFANGMPLRLGVVNGLRTGTTSGFTSELKHYLSRLGFTMELAGVEKANPGARAELERAVGILEQKQCHLLAGVFADELGEDEEDWGSYHEFKSLTVGRGLPSQVVYQSTLGKPFAMANIVLGVVGKTGNIPYVRPEALSYADMVVGIDIARKKKERLTGSINATAITRIYFSNGEFLRYVIYDAPLEGETLPPNVIQGLFPLDTFKGKRVVVHRDGFFRGEEKDTLKRWAVEIGAQFHLVEVIKTGTPRIYSWNNGKAEQPPKGSAFKLSDSEAFLVSSLPPFKDATPQPLRIRTEAPFPIEQALNSVLSLTVLHYGSVRSPRLPVTIHYSDRIAYLALKGIKPKSLEGIIPFWL